MNQERTCPACSQPIKGRTDKRFCSDQCRSVSHNRRRQENNAEKLISRVNAILRKNRTILKNAGPEGNTTVRRLVLELAGFDFRYFTNQFRTQKGNIYHFCYDYGYLLLPEERVLIVNHQLYMNRP